jgi:NAD-dependent dihydropyrimidine dehydrogenase PreA subunit
VKRLISILLLISFVNCATFQTTSDEPITDPQLKIGCAAYEGTAWEKCVIKLFGNYGKIVNTPPTKKFNYKERENEKFVIYHYDLCLGDGTFCIDDPDRKYDPTIWATVRPHLITAGVTAFAMVIGGASARKD